MQKQAGRKQCFNIFSGLLQAQGLLVSIILSSTVYFMLFLCSGRFLATWFYWFDIF